MPLQKKYFITFFTLFLLLTVALSISAYFMSMSILINKYKELSAENLSYLLDITEKEMEELDNTYDFVSVSKVLGKRLGTAYESPDSYQRMLDDIAMTDLFINLSSDKTFDAIQLLYIQGAGTENYWHGAGIDSIDTESIEQMIEATDIKVGALTYLGIGPSYDSIQKKNYMIKFARVLVSLKREVIGTVYFELDASYLSEIFSSERLLTDTSLYLVDKEGRLLYDADSQHVGTLFEDYPSEGIQVSASLDTYGWQLISETPQNYIVADSLDIVRSSIIIGMISIAIAFVAIAIITNRFVKPIRQLTEAVTEVTEGDFSVSVNHTSGDEIGELTNRFNSMTNRIQKNLDNEIAYNKAMNDAEYKALQAQINPHFMYNSLNTLKWIASLQKADNIIEMVDALWILLKKTSSLKGQKVTLASEIEVIQAFSVIQQARYNGKFEMRYEMHEADMNCLIPKYIVQPIVENAMFHGIEPKEGQGIIRIISRRESDNLILQVVDDGVGVSDERMHLLLKGPKETESKKHTQGLNNIGVRNVNDRLLLLYGKTYGLEFESVIGKGTKVTMKIPWQVKGDEGNHV